MNLKTDESVRRMEWGAYNPRVETRGYPMPVMNRVRVNPLIHQWDSTPPLTTHHPLQRITLV